MKSAHMDHNSKSKEDAWQKGSHWEPEIPEGFELVEYVHDGTDPAKQQLSRI
jgi:hypothetical protein